MQRSPDQLPGVGAVLDLAHRAEGSREAEAASDERCELDWRGRHEPDALPAIEVTLGECERAWPELACHEFVEDLLAERDHIIDASAFDEGESRLGGRGHVLEVLGPVEDELGLLPGEIADLAHGEVLAPGQASGQVEDTRSPHDGVVDIEEGRSGEVGFHQTVRGNVGRSRGGHPGNVRGVHEIILRGPCHDAEPTDLRCVTIRS